MNNQKDQNEPNYSLHDFKGTKLTCFLLCWASPNKLQTQLPVAGASLKSNFNYSYLSLELALELAFISATCGW